MIFIGLILIIALCIFARSYYETHNFKIKEYVIETDKISNEIRLGFLSDLHNCTYGEKNQLIVNAIMKQKCNGLLLGGDLIDGKRNIGNTKAEEYFHNARNFLGGVSGKLPVLYVYGNHETRVKNNRNKNSFFNEYMDSIRDLDIEDLNNKLYDLKVGEDTIIIQGIEVNEEAYVNGRYIPVLLNDSGITIEKKYKILLTHPPDFFEDFSKEDIDLILCGHNHGGTIRLPIIKGLVSREYKLFPKYSYGLYEKNNTKMIVSSGLGDHTIHFRLFNMPELVIIRLVPARRNKNT